MVDGKLKWQPGGGGRAKLLSYQKARGEEASSNHHTLPLFNCPECQEIQGTSSQAGAISLTGGICERAIPI